MAVAIDFLSDFEERFWIEPYAEVNQARARSAVEEREELAPVLRGERMQKYKESGNTGVFSRGFPKNEVVFPRRPEHFPIQMILREGNALPDFVFVGYEKGRPMVSRRMQAVIEKHEPAGTGFQFHPMQIM